MIVCFDQVFLYRQLRLERVYVMRLYQFAFIGTPEQQVKHFERIAETAVQEDWGPNYSYLQSYCYLNFEIAYAQNLLYIDAEQRFAVWRIGHLVTDDGTPIYALFFENSLQERQPFKLVSILATHNLVINYRPERNGRAERIHIATPPAPPKYQIPAYQPQYRIEYNWEHYFREHRLRMEECLPNIPERLRYLGVFGAVELAHRLHHLNAIPQFYNGNYQYLLPLYITHAHINKRPDIVAALREDRDRGVYTVPTLLLPEMAYANARAIATNIAQFRSWIDDVPAPTLPPEVSPPARQKKPPVPPPSASEAEERSSGDEGEDLSELQAPFNGAGAVYVEPGASEPPNESKELVPALVVVGASQQEASSHETPTSDAVPVQPPPPSPPVLEVKQAEPEPPPLPSTPEEWWEQANLSFQAENYEQTLEAVQHCIALVEPENPFACAPAYELQGDALYQLEKYPQAKQAHMTAGKLYGEV